MRTAAGVFKSLRAMTVISGADGVALMLTDPQGRLRAVGGSSAEGMELEYAQQFERRGPSHECLAANRPVAVPDLRRHGGADYARLVRRAASIRAVLSVPLRIDGALAGSLNFYRHAPHAWSADQVAGGQQLADAFAVLLVRLAQQPAFGEAG
jgi:GAF domain-containing protein